MKIGPGVDLLLPSHHAGSGLYIQPQPDGHVRVMVTNGEWPMRTGQNLRADVTLSPDAWASVASFVAARPLSGETFKVDILYDEARQSPDFDGKSPAPEELG